MYAWIGRDSGGKEKEGSRRKKRKKRKGEKETYDFGRVYPRTDDFESYFCVLLDDLCVSSE